MKIALRLLPAAFLLLAFGCSKSSSHTATAADGTKITQSSKGDKVSMDLTSKSGGNTSLNVSESGMALPKDFAKDIPIHPKGVVQMFNQIGADHTQLAIVVALPAAEVTAFYEAEFKKQGWAGAPSINRGEGITMMWPKKDQRSISLTISPQDPPQDPKTTFVMMMITTAAK
ncbi:MAG: hypothetical protein PSW75_01620 [bacterium]|nr:hypothetical protein [bacterium]MDI1335138.1 hypothetical protein [Lacunisphaera sp.]